MFIRRLEITNFRNHEHTLVDFEPGNTVFLGDNGQGKTSLVEAIRFLSTLSSHRVAGYLPLIGKNKNQAAIRVFVEANNRELLVELAINRSESNKAFINRNQVNRLRDVIGSVQSITFAPEDLDIVKRDPSNRREFMDELLIQRNPRFSGVFSDFARVLKQRNTLLKSAKQTGAKNDSLSTLDAWDEQLVKFGSEILAARVELIEELWPKVQSAYKAIALTNNDVELIVETSILGEIAIEDEEEMPVLSSTDKDEIAEMFRKKLNSIRGKELDRGLTLVGPQRDELLIRLGDLPAKGYASHGESWSLALALRLGSAELLREVSSVGDPILILDDVFAELDSKRRKLLATLVDDYEQVVITAASADDVPENLNAKTYKIREGRLLDE